MVDQRSSKKRAVKSPEPDVGVSAKSLTIARIIDRLCLRPGQYQITVTIPSHKRDEWRVTFNKLEKLREVNLRR